MQPIARRFSTACAALLLLAPLPFRADGAVVRVPADQPTIQAALAAVDAGDTVLVAPGSYPRRVQIDKAVLLAAEGPEAPVLSGLTGGRAVVRGMAFDTGLASGDGPLVAADSGLRLEDCSFRGTTVGVGLLDGAGDVVIAGCVFRAQIQAVNLPPLHGNVLMEGITVEDCALGVVSGGTFVCDAGVRRPAERCLPGGCAEVVVRGATFTGGEVQIDIGPGVLLRAEECTFAAATTALRVRGGRLEVLRCTLTGLNRLGTGLVLESVSGTLRESSVLGFATGAEVGDGGCPQYSDIVIGGSLADGNVFGNNVVQFRLLQEEPVDLDYNHWGTVDCPAAQERIEGQDVRIITDGFFLFPVFCDVPVEPASWGSIKLRYEGDRR